MKKIVITLPFLCVSFALPAQRDWDTIPFIPDHYAERMALFAKQGVVTDKIMFLGNSITEGGNWAALLNDSTVVNRGIGGDITFGILHRMDDIIKWKPSKLFLLIGINDLAKNIPDDVIIKNIFSIVGKIHKGSANTKVFVQSILPTNRALEKFPAHYNRDDHVIVINRQLKKKARKFGFTFVDIYNRFLNKENHLDFKYTHDGLHLNGTGYQHWVHILKELKCL